MKFSLLRQSVRLFAQEAKWHPSARTRRAQPDDDPMTPRAITSTTTFLIFSAAWLSPTSAQTWVEEEIEETVVLEEDTLMAEDFDLEAVLAIVESERSADAASLETLINADPALNNVDIDGDGFIDHISVRELRDGADVVLQFTAIPSSTGRGAVEVASLTFVEAASEPEVRVVAAYPDYVDHHYVYTTSLVQRHGFVTWVYRPYRPVYTTAYVWCSPVRPVYGPSVVVHHRRAWRSAHPIHVHRAPRGTFVARRRFAPRRDVIVHRSRSRGGVVRRGAVVHRRGRTTVHSRGPRTVVRTRSGNTTSRRRGDTTSRRRGTTTSRRRSTPSRRSSRGRTSSRRGSRSRR